MEEIRHEPIGRVRSSFESPADVPRVASGSTEATGRIEVATRYEAGLTKLGGFSRVVVLAHLHRVDDYVLRASPPFTDDCRPGVFATRSPHRPNSITQSICRLRRVDGATLRVDDVDLVDGTPVLDLEPFAPKPHEVRDVSDGWLDACREESESE